MSAETLRKAAALMRDRWAESARPAAGQAVGTMPPTMLAVADWLENFAHHWDLGDYSIDETTAALAVAGAYLGESA